MLQKANKRTNKKGVSRFTEGRREENPDVSLHKVEEILYQDWLINFDLMGLWVIKGETKDKKELLIVVDYRLRNK